MKENAITPGKSASASATVDNTNIARTVGSGSLDVFATPMMVALMEQAACAALADVLEDGQTSVGTSLSVNHIAASPPGAQITATATVTSVDGRKIDFAVSAQDSNREIGNGKHTRVIVDAEKFIAKTINGA